jgi:hypothetical protein
MTEMVLSIALWLAVWVTVGTAVYLVYGNRPTTLPLLLRLRAFYKVQDSARAISRLLGTMLLWPAFASLVFERSLSLALPFALLAPALLVVGSACSERANRFVLGSVMLLTAALAVATLLVYHETD